MTSIESVTLEVSDPTAALAFYAAAFGVGTQVAYALRTDRTTGFRGFTMSTRRSPTLRSAAVRATGATGL